MQAAALELVIAAIAAWLAIGALGLVRTRSLVYISRGLFPIEAAIALALGVVAFIAIPLPAQTTVLPLGVLTGVTDEADIYLRLPKRQPSRVPS